VESSEHDAFASAFKALTGFTPFRWQERLYTRFVEGDLPAALDLPTGLGKTSVMTIWLLARTKCDNLPRRLVYVVDRRVVVDQATEEAAKLAKATNGTVTVSTLRGQFVGNRDWLADPGAPAIIVGTIDMIGSRLLFEGYGVGRRMRPYQAGLLGADTLVVLDEAHLSPPFEALLRSIEGDDSLKPRGADRRAIVPRFRLLTLSATGRAGDGDVFRLEPEDHDCATQRIVHERYTAAKRLRLEELATEKDLAGALAERAWALGEGGSRVLVFCDRYDTAQTVEATLRKQIAKAPDTALEVLVGKRRVRERQALVCSLRKHGFLHPATGERPPRDAPAFVVATSAGEVGIDIDADHMVCDLVAFERMVQRLGRVNRRGGEGREATVEVFYTPPEPAEAGATVDEKTRKAAAQAALLAATKSLLQMLPPGDDGRHDASPQALADLKARIGAARIEAATTPAPLRPALDRAVVDAWSMTSLKEHPGRPEPEPWLRGWVDEDEPQTQVIWRRFLPWRRGDDLPGADEVEAFFAAAPPHASEVLEAPVRLVLDTLVARARAVGQQRAAGAAPAVEQTSPEDETSDASEERTAGSRPVTQEGLLVLTSARELKRLADPPRGARTEAGIGAWTLEDLAAAEDKKADREALGRLMRGAIVVVSASLGGLDGNGLLAKDAAAALSCADADNWETGFRVLAPGEEKPDDTWKRAVRFQLETGDEDEPRTLSVLVSREKRGLRAGDPAIARKAQSLKQHGEWAAEAAGEIAHALDLPDGFRAMLEAAAKAHDRGKDRKLWQDAMRAPRNGRPWAKTTAAGDPARLKIGRHTYRHEFGSLRDVERDPKALAGVPEELHDLARHLIASHHGYARPLIAPVDPVVPPAESEQRAAEAALRFARLQRDWGPWGLAWWEALLRAADWRASARNDDSDKASDQDASAAEARLGPVEESA